MVRQAYLSGVEKFVAIGSICASPKLTPMPFHEDTLWDGYPEETNAPYGLAKKMLLVRAQAYRQQYQFNATTFFRATCTVLKTISIRDVLMKDFPDDAWYRARNGCKVAQAG